MVRRTSWKQIVFGIVLFALILAFTLRARFLHDSSIKSPVYSATNESLDLAILDGIVGAEKESTQKSEENIKAVVVPHHLITPKSIALGIKALASSTPRVIIIISPDHYALCPKLLCTTKGSYESFFGKTIISESDVAQLEKSPLVADSELFDMEHGIYSIVPFIKHYIPDAQIIPIAISQKGRGTEKERVEIIRLLKPLLARKDVSLVISSDFSHYLPLAESKIMDKKTQKSFCSGNSQEILTLNNPSQSDCPLCLWILEQQAKELGFWNPEMISHTNSADLLRDASIKETTSHFVFTLSEIPSFNECLK